MDTVFMYAEDLPYIEVPLHRVMKITPKAYGANMEVITLGPDAVNTHRTKPEVPFKTILLSLI